jgi:hypothetical protein
MYGRKLRLCLSISGRNHLCDWFVALCCFDVGCGFTDGRVMTYEFTKYEDI